MQDSEEIDVSAGPGEAVREVRLRPGRTDFLLYVDAKAIGIVEARKEGHTLKGVQKQSMDYLDGPSVRGLRGRQESAAQC